MTVSIELLTTLVLVVIAVVAVVGLVAAQRRGTLTRWWGALCPDFTGFTQRNGRINTDRGTNRTLNLLGSATLVFLIMLFVWALGAGVLRTAWLYSCSPDGFAAKPPVACKTALGLANGWDRATFAVILVAEMMRAAAAVLAIAMTATLIGAAVGFLFGIPRYEAPAAAPPPQQGGQGAQTAAAAQQQAATRLQLNTNLIKVSDWLTNGIVVLSLVEAKAAGAQFIAIADWAALWLFDSRHGSPALITAAMLGGAVFGFLYATVYTQLIITRLLAAVDDSLRLPAGLRLGGLSKYLFQDEVLAPQISRSAHAPDPPEQPSPDTLRAAHGYDDIAFEDLVCNADVTAEDILNWARAKALLNDYRAAARGYLHLLGMRLPA